MLTREQKDELRARGLLVLLGALALLVISLTGCDRRACARQQCQREVVLVVVNNGVGVPIYDDVCQCLEFAPLDGGAK